MSGAVGRFAKADNFCKQVFECRLEGRGTVSKTRARFSTSLRWFRKGQAFTCVYSLFAASLIRSCVVFHLPIPIVLFDRIRQGSQFTTLFGRELINGCFNLFHAAHVQTLFASRTRTRADQYHVTIRRRTSRLRLRKFHQQSAGDRSKATRQTVEAVDASPALS